MIPVSNISQLIFQIQRYFISWKEFNNRIILKTGRTSEFSGMVVSPASDSEELRRADWHGSGKALYRPVQRGRTRAGPEQNRQLERNRHNRDDKGGASEEDDRGRKPLSALVVAWRERPNPHQQLHLQWGRAHQQQEQQHLDHIRLQLSARSTRRSAKRSTRSSSAWSWATPWSCWTWRIIQDTLRRP